MADATPTGAPGQFQKRGGRRAEVTTVPPGQTGVAVPPEAAVQLLGLITRLQNVEAQLSLLRREKLIAGEETEKRIVIADEQAQETIDGLQTENARLQRILGFVESNARSAIAYVIGIAFVNDGGLPLTDQDRNTVSVHNNAGQGAGFVRGVLARFRSFQGL